MFALAALGCGARDLGALAGAEGVSTAGILRLSDTTAVATRNRGGLVELLWFEEKDGVWASQVIGSHQTDEPESGDLIGYGGQTGLDWNTFFYGTALPSASRMTVDRSDATGGQVVDGAWVIAIRAKDISPEVAWTLLDASGRTTASGSGPFPPIP